MEGCKKKKKKKDSCLHLHHTEQEGDVESGENVKKHDPGHGAAVEDVLQFAPATFTGARRSKQNSQRCGGSGPLACWRGGVAGPPRSPQRLFVSCSGVPEGR